PSLDRLRGATALPGFVATMQPSDFPGALAAALVPLAWGLPRGERFSEPAARAFADAQRVGDFGSGFSAAPALPRGPSGTSQVTGPSVAAAPRTSTPPGASSPSPDHGDDDYCLLGWQTLGHPGAQSFRGRIPHGSAARLPTHQSRSYLPDCKADY